MLGFLKKNWFFAGIFVAIFVAFTIPTLGQWVRKYRIVDMGIFLAFFITGLTLDTSKIGDELRRFKVPLAAMISSLLVIPLLSWLLATLVLPPPFVVGVCIIATAPVTVTAGTVMTDLGRGNVPLSIFICVLGNFMAVFTIPFSLKLLLNYYGEIDLPVFQMLSGLAFTVLLPTTLGQLLRPRLKESLIQYRKCFSIVQQGTILLIIFNAIASSTDHIFHAGTSVVLVLVVMVFLHSSVLVMNFTFARLLGLDRSSTTAFTIHTSQKTLTVSYIVWAGYFATEHPMALIPGIGYHLTQTIMDSIVAQRFRVAAEKLTATKNR
jgi:solute carrier family 10 (sodium/bile acid cotransporter), member 7